MDRHELWTQIEADLKRARSTLQNNAATHKAIKEYEDFLSHNELELACEALEGYAESDHVSKIFGLPCATPPRRCNCPNMRLGTGTMRAANSDGEFVYV